MDFFAILASVISAITLAIVMAVAHRMNKALREFQAEHKALVESQRDQIKGEILRIHANAVARGYITYIELDYINDKFPHYQNLHGNTYVPDLVQSCNKMPIKGDPVPKH